jgi:hypothetical protein
MLQRGKSIIIAENVQVETLYGVLLRSYCMGYSVLGCSVDDEDSGSPRALAKAEYD